MKMPPKKDKRIEKRKGTTAKKQKARATTERNYRAAKENKAVRISRLEVTDFKALDRLVLDLPPPQMAGDPDVFVLGSRNGLGKTSVLEACALLLVVARMEPGLRKEFFRMRLTPERRYERNVNFADLFVRSGAEMSRIVADLNVKGTMESVDLLVSRKGHLGIKPEKPKLRSVYNRGWPGSWEIMQIADSLASFSPEPLVMPPLLYFHSYRKIAEGVLESGAWIEHPIRGRLRRPGGLSTSAFKVEILSLLMRKADLFEGAGNDKAESVEALDQLNELIERYAGGRIEKLLPAPDNTIEFRITPTTSESQSFGFDGLSSGQKEVISTLFLIWRYAREAPSIILIDEPELHLNPEWQRDFVQEIYKITPNSQIIIATHSEDIFGSVPEDRRILLGK